jgi:hypothetical protein
MIAFTLRATMVHVEPDQQTGGGVLMHLVLSDTQYKEALYKMYTEEPERFTSGVKELSVSGITPAQEAVEALGTVAAKDVQYEEAGEKAEEDHTASTRAARRR